MKIRSCPRCGHKPFGVTNTIPFDDHIRRYRKCTGCGFKATTHEQLVVRKAQP